MKTIEITSGLDIPISGEPAQQLSSSPDVEHVAIVGDDYIGMKPTMNVCVGDRVKTGQLLFSDKKNPGVQFTAPACGEIVAINRGAKRKFESLIIRIDGTEFESFIEGDKGIEEHNEQEITNILVDSGLWTGFRTRPFGKIPAIGSTPTALFITVAETNPLAAAPQVIIDMQKDEFLAGLEVLEKAIAAPIHMCSNAGDDIPTLESGKIQQWAFSGPHPAGLPSTHIHMIAPVDENHIVWHISYQDVIAIGHLFITGTLLTEKIIALSGPSVKEPSLVKVPIGAKLSEICAGKISEAPNRILSGSVLNGRAATEVHDFLGRYHNQVSVLADDSGRSFFNWALPGSNRFSKTPVFSSALKKGLRFPMPTATWGGGRAIYPLGTYDKVIPLDIIATSLLKSLAVSDTEKAKALGALELIEEDIALCSFVCPGKNDFGPMLRDILTTIEQEG